MGPASTPTSTLTSLPVFQAGSWSGHTSSRSGWIGREGQCPVCHTETVTQGYMMPISTVCPVSVPGSSSLEGLVSRAPFVRAAASQPCHRDMLEACCHLGTESPQPPSTIALPSTCAEYKPRESHKKTPAQVLALRCAGTIGTGCAQITLALKATYLVLVILLGPLGVLLSKKKPDPHPKSKR